MTITNELDSNLALLSRINSDGKTQSETLNLLLTSTSHTSFIKGSPSVRLLEFIKKDIITHQLSLKDNPVPTDYLNRIEIAVEFFEINLDYFPHQLGDLKSFDSLLTLITFLVTIVLPIKSIELRLMVLNSKIFKTFTQSMQFLLRLQTISSYISIEQLSNAKSFVNQTKSKYKKLSNLSEFKSLQETLLKVKQENSDLQMSFESHGTSVIDDRLINQDSDVKLEEDLLDIKPDLDLIQSKQKDGLSDDDEPLLNTTSNKSTNQDPIEIIDEETNDTKPDINRSQPPRRSSRKRQVTSDDDQPLINRTSTNSSIRHEVIEDLSDPKPIKKPIKRSKRSSKKPKDSSDDDDEQALLNGTSNMNPDRPKLDDLLSRMSELIEELQKSKGVSKQECKKTFEKLDDQRMKIRSVKYINRQVPKSDQHMRTYQTYQTWCSNHQFSELPITFTKAFLWTELYLRSYSVHHLKMMRRIRELNWFRSQTISMGSDEDSFWPDFFWNEYFEDHRFPIVFITKGGDPRRVAYPRKNINQMNKFPAPMPPQRKREPDLSPTIASGSSSDQKTLKGGHPIC